MKAMLLFLSVLLAGDALAGWRDNYNSSNNSRSSWSGSRSSNWNSDRDDRWSGSGSHCRHDEWYSKTYRKCYKKKGYCSQYNHTDSRTCNSGNDWMKCDWNHHSRTCYTEVKHPTHPSPTQCRHDEWYSSHHRKCFKKYGHCSQY